MIKNLNSKVKIDRCDKWVFKVLLHDDEVGFAKAVQISHVQFLIVYVEHLSL